jgi:hypothetical protein
MGGGETKENDGGGELNYDIRTFVNVTMHSPIFFIVLNNKKLFKKVKKGKNSK